MLNALSVYYLHLLSYLDQDEGQDFIEYALIIAVVVLVALVALTSVGGAVAGIWDDVAGKLVVPAGG